MFMYLYRLTLSRRFSAARFQSKIDTPIKINAHSISHHHFASFSFNKNIFSVYRRPVLLRTESQSAKLRQDFQRQDQGFQQRCARRPENEHRRAAITIPTESDGSVQRSPGRCTLSSHAARHVAHAQLRQRNG